jgi:hypothetical protein
VLCPIPRQTGQVRVSIVSLSTRPSPRKRRIGVCIDSFRVRSNFTRISARWIDGPPKVAFLTRLRPGQFPNQAARHLSKQSTTLSMDPQMMRACHVALRELCRLHAGTGEHDEQHVAPRNAWRVMLEACDHAEPSGNSATGRWRSGPRVPSNAAKTRLRKVPMATVLPISCSTGMLDRNISP